MEQHSDVSPYELEDSSNDWTLLHDADRNPSKSQEQKATPKLTRNCKERPDQPGPTERFAFMVLFAILVTIMARYYTPKTPTESCQPSNTPADSSMREAMSHIESEIALTQSQLRELTLLFKEQSATLEKSFCLNAACAEESTNAALEANTEIQNNGA